MQIILFYLFQSLLMDESTMDSQEGEDEPMEAKTIQVNYRFKDRQTCIPRKMGSIQTEK